MTRTTIVDRIKENQYRRPLRNQLRNSNNHNQSTIPTDIDGNIIDEVIYHPT